MKRGTYKPKIKNEKALKNFLIKDEVKDKANIIKRATIKVAFFMLIY